MSLATEQLDLIKRSRRDQRADLQEVTDAHVALAATTVLIFNQAKLNDHLLGQDPNTPIEVPIDNGEPSDPVPPFAPAMEQ